METADLYQVLEEQYFGEKMQEREEIEQLPGLLKNVSVFVDVGAGLGQYSFFANRILSHGKIFCIEADPVRFDRLRELSSQWERSSGNQINLVHAAAAERDAKAEFFTTSANASGGLFAPPVGKSVQWARTEVNCVCLDTLFRDLKPDLVKIDVEGAEYRVLLGALGILKQGSCRFLVEIHPWGDQALKKHPADIFRLFAQFGYDFQRAHRHWLFEKSDRPLKRFVKHRLIVIVMQNAWLKSALKKCILALPLRK